MCSALYSQLLKNPKILCCTKIKMKHPGVTDPNQDKSFSESCISVQKEHINQLPNGKITFAKQLGIALAIGSCNFMQGYVEGWTANLPKIQEDKSVGFNLTMSDVQWLISSMYLSALPSNLFGGIIGDFIGYKKLLTILLPIIICLWAALAYTTTVGIFYFARLLQGFIFGLQSVLVSPLISEVCEPEVRGFAIVTAELIIGIGVLLGYLQAHLFYWRTATILCALPCVLTFILLLFIPESPYWYLRHGKYEEASKSLDIILGERRSHRKVEILQEMKQSKANESKPSVLVQLKLLHKKQNWKPLLLLMAIFFLRESGGKSSVFLYTVYLFRSAGVVIDPFVCTLFVGVARLVTIFLCALIIDKVGRKVIFMTCTFICVLCLLIAGGILILDSTNSFSRYIPLICVIIFTVSYCLGMSPIPWPLAAELLPLPVKPISVSIVCFTYSISLFGMSNLFPTLLSSFGLGKSLLCFSVSYIILFFILGLCLPETKGKTLTELEKIFESKPSDQSTKSIGISNSAC